MLTCKKRKATGFFLFFLKHITTRITKYKGQTKCFQIWKNGTQSNPEQPQFQRKLKDQVRVLKNLSESPQQGRIS